MDNTNNDMKNSKQKSMLSEHFSLEEVSYSRIAVENAIDNMPPPEVQEALRHLIVCLLEPLRQVYGKPIAILSGYRSEKVNRMAGGVADSQHRKGEAVDCYTPDVKGLLSVLRYSGLVFDQAILYPKRNFLHLSLKLSGKNRMQVLILLLCLAFLLPGCGISRHSRKQETTFHLDTTNISILQASSLKQNFHFKDTATLQISKVVYSPPDSSGRLYPYSITSLQMDYSGQSADSSLTEQRTQSQYTRQQEEALLVASSSALEYSKRYLLLLCGVLFIVSTIYFHSRKT